MIGIYTEAHKDLELLTFSDQVAARTDLIMFGMFVLDKRDGYAIRMDPRDVQFDGKNVTVGHESNIAVALGLEPKRSIGLREFIDFMFVEPYVSAMVERRIERMNVLSEAFDMRFRFNDESLSIWRKHDPGAQ